MVTALALQLIQCVVKLPSHVNNEHDFDDLSSPKDKNDFVCAITLCHCLVC